MALRLNGVLGVPMQSKWFKAMGAVIGVVVLLMGLAVYGLRGSLPALDGAIGLSGLSQPVTLARDADGVVTLTATTPVDEAMAMGFAHAQDRFFQMDLARRLAAGELSELVGAAAVNTDKKMRVHRFRARATQTLTVMSDTDRALLSAYTQGVNQGLRQLAVRPFEYLLLRQSPQAWRVEDSLLVVDSMFLQLQQFDGHHHLAQGLLRQHLPAAAADFLLSPAVEWEAAQDGTPADAAGIPSATEWNLRQETPSEATQGERVGRHPRERPVIGSNNWAIAGARTHSGAALVANDMHLGLRVPNTWYRIQLRCACRGDDFVVTGVTLPGAPVVVVGSNTHIAWGFTNSYGDYQNVIALNQSGLAERLYRTHDGVEELKTVHETLRVQHGAAIDLPVQESRFGPVIETTSAGQKLVLEWTAHSPLAINLQLTRLGQAESVAEALDIAAGAGIPAQNFTVGDRAGHIGWTIAGQIPKRQVAPRPIIGSDEPKVGFAGFIAPNEHPRLLDPKAGQIVTANARVVGGAALKIIGDGGYDRGARALQISNDLKAQATDWTESQSLQVALDDRAVFLTRWKDYLLAQLDQAALVGHPRRAELKTVLEHFSGHAAVTDAGYRLMRLLRENIEQRLYTAAIAEVKQQHPQFEFSPPASFEGPLWRWLNAKPMHLLPAEYASYRDLVLQSIDAVLNDLNQTCPVLAQCTWGQVNVLAIHHPLAPALGTLGQWLNMPSQMMPGDQDMPRAQGPAFGASERMAVSPGHEADGIFEMPTGQSGHPWSPFYGRGHAHWVRGDAAPFLPGPVQHSLSLTPNAG